MINDCPLRRTKNSAPDQLTLPAPLVIRNQYQAAKELHYPPNNMHLITPKKTGDLEWIAEGAKSFISQQKKLKHHMKYWRDMLPSI